MASVIDPLLHAPHLPGTRPALALAAHPPAAGGGDGAPTWTPPRRWPAKAALDYYRDAITTLLLVLALPYLVVKLLTRPGDVLEAAGRHRVEGK